MLLKTLLLGTALTLLASPAGAVLTISFQDVGSAITVSCSDGAACDNQGAAREVLQINQTIGQFQVIGTFAASSNGSLQSSNLAIFNLGGTTDTLRMLVGDTGFTAPITGIREAGSLTFNGDVGASASTLAFFADTGNAQPTFGSPGSLLFAVSHVPVSSADAQSGVHTSVFSATAPFAMAEFAELNMIAGSDITNFGQTMDTVSGRGVGGVPEPATWGMLLLGFIGIGLFGLRRRWQFRLV
jgi:PEP-CTERM motif